MIKVIKTIKPKNQREQLLDNIETLAKLSIENNESELARNPKMVTLKSELSTARLALCEHNKLSPLKRSIIGTTQDLQNTVKLIEKKISRTL